MYLKHYGRNDARVIDIPKNPLLFVSTHPSRELEKDMRTAGIPKNIPGEGKLDFHSLRVCFVTMIINAGANAKEAEELARHSNPDITMNTYAKTRNDQLATLVNKVSTVLPQKKCALCVPNEENGGDGQSAISPTTYNLDAAKGWWRRRDSKPLGDNNLHNKEPLQNTYTNATIPCKTKQLHQQEFAPEIKTFTLSEHKPDTSLQKKCAVYVPFHKVPLDLRLVIEAWESLTKETRLQIARQVLEDVT